MNSLEELFCHIDDFCRRFEPQWRQTLLGYGVQQRDIPLESLRERQRALSLSEIMTVLVSFHRESYRTFKHFYQKRVCCYWPAEFPKLPSYQRFVEYMPDALIPLCVYLKHCFGPCSGISFIDATALKVCHNRRINQHQVFEEWAARANTSVNWFYGFKVHLVVNEVGELLNMTVTPGNTDDRKPVPDLLSGLFGKVFADRGYVSQKLAQQLL